MKAVVLGWIQIVGGVLALLFSGKAGFAGMMQMAGVTGDALGASGFAIIVLSLVIITSGIYHATEKGKK